MTLRDSAVGLRRLRKAWTVKSNVVKPSRAGVLVVTCIERAVRCGSQQSRPLDITGLAI